MRRQTGFRIGAIVLSLLALEGGARVWLYDFASPDVYPEYAVPDEFPTAAKYKPHHYLGYVLQPGYRKGPSRHNARGFRGEDIEIPKPRGRWRIAILGGSTTYGEFIPRDEETLPGRLDAMLKDRIPAADIEVINAGAPGYNSWESLINLQFRVLDLEPDVVILFDGVNDVHSRFVHPDAYRADNSGRRQLWAEPAEVRLLKWSVLGRILARQAGLWRLPGIDSYTQSPTSDPGLHGPSPAIGGEPMAALDANSTEYSKRNAANMIASCRAHGVAPVVMTWPSSPLKGDYIATPHYQRGVSEHNAVLREVASVAKAPLFDLARWMPTTPALWRDGRHPNETGATWEANALATFLIENGLAGNQPPASPGTPKPPDRVYSN